MTDLNIETKNVVGNFLFRVVDKIRTNLFNSVSNTIVSLIALYILYLIIPPIMNWAIFDAVWSAQNMRACRSAGTGACWAFIGEKWRFILFGRYTYDEQWREALVTLILLAMTGASFSPSLWRRELLYAWAVSIILSGILMFGGVFGLPYVSTDLWSGLPLTVILSLFSMIAAFPLAIMLALGRRSNLPLIKAVSTFVIEVMRGVPLITVLFMASLMLPLFLPSGMTVDKQLRALIGITLFLAAYQAEDIRGGLQAISKGQYEAADALGLGYWQKMRLIILPQALTIVIPPLVSNLIGTFKNTSLVSIISLFDLLETSKNALIDPNWRGLSAEAYLFVGAIYFVGCYTMSRYSRWLEVYVNRGKKR